jgi:hypothetical protein
MTDKQAPTSTPLKPKRPNGKVRRENESEDVTNKRRAKVFAAQMAERSRASADVDVSKDPLAIALAQDFLIGAETGRHVMEEISDEVQPEENGGPFLVTSAQREFADGTDGTNPEDAEPAAFPAAQRAD